VLLFVGFCSFLDDFLDPGVVEGLFGRGAFVGVLFEHPGDEVFAVG
jgi:hypothetical protein